jgi:microcystin-dependent protein
MPGTPTTKYAIPTLAGTDQGLTIDDWSQAAMAAIDTLLAERAAHTGALQATALGSAPSGWLLCDGSAISRATFAALYAAIGTTYGAGNGTTTFNIPDLRGRVPVGVDGAAARLTASDALGNSGGEEKHQLTTGELAAHTHGGSTGSSGASHQHSMPNGQNIATWDTSLGAAAGVAVGAVSGSGPKTNPGDANHTHTIASQGSDTPHNNMPPYQVVNWLIKA